MNELWERIIAWFAANAPPEPEFFSLAPGADEWEIRSTETTLRVAFPDDVRESYLLHNGSNRTGVFECGRNLFSLDAIMRGWQIKGSISPRKLERLGGPPQLVGPIKKIYWSPLWIPISDTGSGDYMCIDMDPAQGGRVGQVIDTSNEVGPLAVLAVGFREFLTQYAEDLEAGKFWYDENSGMVRRYDQSERPNP
jgi:cell wall assembly regulator SMI1